MIFLGLFQICKGRVKKRRKVWPKQILCSLLISGMLHTASNSVFKPFVLSPVPSVADTKKMMKGTL